MVDTSQEQEEDEEMEEGDIEGTAEERNEASTSKASAAAVNTPSASTSSRKAPAVKKTQPKKREGAELKAPPSKRKPTAISDGGSGDTPVPGGSQQQQQQQQAKKKKGSRAQIMFQSVMSGKSALKVHVVDKRGLSYSRKLSREKTFTNLWRIRNSQRKLSWIASTTNYVCVATDFHRANFCGWTQNLRKFVKVLSLKHFPLESSLIVWYPSP